MTEKNKTAKKSGKLSGFTLAETLVTVGIIGFIAALTIPSLQDFSQSRSNATLAMKAYSTLSNATKALKAEYGPIRTWDLSSASKVADLYKEKMNAAGVTTESYATKYLNDNAYTNANMFNNTTSFITADGMLFYVQSVSASCTGANEGLWKGCIDWGVDVNGAKGPNKVGIDIFGFYVNTEGVFPEGTIDGVYDRSSCNKTGLGWSCSTRVIEEGAINWK